MFVILKKEDIVPVDISVEDALKVVISGGAIIPPQQKTDKI
jgi:uncharacterized membrane protein